MSWQGYADFIIEKGKGLSSHENKPFYTPFGGDKRDRTADLLNAIQALSQLSYTPIFACAFRTGRPNELYFNRAGGICQLFFPLFLTDYLPKEKSPRFSQGSLEMLPTV